MNTAMRETVPANAASPAAEAPGAELDLVFESVPRVLRTRRVAGRAVDFAPHRVAERRPRDGRPGTAGRVYGHGPVRAAQRPRGGHPMEERVERAQVGFAVLALAALCSALLVAALIGLAHWRADLPEQAPDTDPGVVERYDAPEHVLPR